jgi:hypothetical protein
MGMHFVGRTGRFVPVTKESGGGILYRVHEGKNYSVSGTKGYFWVESEVYRNFKDEMVLDNEYYERLIDEAVKTIEEFIPFDCLVNSSRKNTEYNDNHISTNG